MTALTLQRNVQFLYEDHLARIELRAFGCDEFRRDEDNPWRIEANVNGHAEAIRLRSAYFGRVDEDPTVYAELIRPAYQGGRFNRTRSVNQYLTHWIYPYRGKFHPQMVRALLNILGVRAGARLLEPFGGSGTTALEAQLLGADCVSIDRNPVCVLVSQVKTGAWRSAEVIRARVTQLLEDRNLEPEDVNPLQENDPELQRFLQVALLVTCSDTERRSRESGPALRKNLAAMLESVEAQATAIREFGIQAGAIQAVAGDARDLGRAGVDPDSIDGIVTSPPYSLALDYVKNDDHALRALGVNADALREQMIGVRGKGAGKKLAAYNQDMQRVFAEVARVLKPGAGAAFVIGDATVGGEEVTTTGEMVTWAEDAGLRLERNIPKIVFGLYNVMQDERILIFRKS